jgi:hypothetical protein
MLTFGLPLCQLADKLQHDDVTIIELHQVYLWFKPTLVRLTIAC